MAVVPSDDLPTQPPADPSEACEEFTGPEGVDYVALRDTELDIGELYGRVLDGGAGAVSMFAGVTRDNFDGRPVVRLEYEAYPAMAMREMARLCANAREKWPDILRMSVVHRIGVCPVSDASVVILVSSPHRKESLEAVTWAIDALKARVPIWKKEFYADPDLDGSSASRWKANSECFFHGHHGAHRIPDDHSLHNHNHDHDHDHGLEQEDHE